MKKLSLHKVVIALAIGSAFIAGDALAMGASGGGAGAACDPRATNCPGHHQKQSSKRSNMSAHSYDGADYEYHY